MKVLLLIASTLFAYPTFAGDCVTNALGRTTCANGQHAATVNPRSGTVTTAQKSAGGFTTAQSSNGTKAAYNPHTGNSAVSQTNQNGVKTTQTARGGQAKTKNGMGVAEGPGGTKCAKGAYNQGCKQ
jgi:hypothetical protein